MATQTRNPTSDEAASGTLSGSAGSRWQLVDDYPDTSGADILTFGTTTALITFGYSAFTVPVGATSISVQVLYYDGEAANGSNNCCGRLKVGGSYFNASTHNPSGTSYTSRNDNFANNPQTAAAWTVDQVNGVGSNALQAFGIGSTDSNPTFRVSSVQLQVTYTPLADRTGSGSGSASTQTGSGTGAAIETGSGGTAVAAQTGIGAGDAIASGSGGATGSVQTGSGAGTVGDAERTGSGAGSAAAQTGTGSGAAKAAGSGAAAASAQTGGGAGDTIAIGSGSSSAGEQAGAGTGTSRIAAGGSAAASVQAGGGAGLLVVTGSGSGSAPIQAGSGSGGLDDGSITGAGSGVATKQTGAGSGTVPVAHVASRQRQRSGALGDIHRADRGAWRIRRR